MRSIRFRSKLFVLAALLALATHPAPALAQEITYEYDALGRLILVASPEGIAQYEYDAVGNILRITTRRYADVAGPVAILAVTPSQGAPGTTVRLFGKGFATTLTDNQVAFNGTPATVTAATSGTLTTTVPSGATTGPISLTAPLGSATSPEPFTVLQAFTVSPAQADVALGGTLGFQATLDGTPTNAVTWRVNGIVGGNAQLGTVTPAGLYTAPTIPPPVQPLSIEAVLTADPTQVATASVRVVGQASGLESAAPVSVGVVSPSSPAASGQVSVAVTPQSAPAASGPVSVGPTPVSPPVASGPLSVTRGPVISAVSPSAGAVGASGLSVTLAGANFQGASQVQFLLNGSLDSTLTAASVVPAGDGTGVSFTVTISGSAATGSRVVQVVTPQGTSTSFNLGTNTFTVTAP